MIWPPSLLTDTDPQQQYPLQFVAAPVPHLAARPIGHGDSKSADYSVRGLIVAIGLEQTSAFNRPRFV